MKKPFSLHNRLATFRIIIMGFASVILCGALILMLPISSRSGRITSFPDALFTATSATCVTGLVVQDTASYWSPFGQAVILLLIQAGGMGVLTVAVLLTMISGRKISLMQRSIMQESYASPKLGGIVKLTGFIVRTSLAIELIGAILLAPSFCKDYGLRGLWLALFHSISAFCNAGFDLLGTSSSRFVSLTPYADRPAVLIVIMLLIVVGGIGFLTWEDIYKNRLHFKKYRLQTKVILSTTAFLIFVPFVLYFFGEYTDLPLGSRLLTALFQAITPRTAGFNTVDLNGLTGSGTVIMILLMLIGGSPGSTAGGMKTTTVTVLFANLLAVFHGKDDAHIYGRRIDQHVIRNASTLVLLYGTLCIGGGLIISTLENLPVDLCLFETASAVGTVGLTLGITPQLGHISRLILILFMFIGRVGGLTLIYAAMSNNRKNISNLPVESVTVG